MRKNTENYGLCLWGPTEHIQWKDLNANSEITDTILGVLDNELEELEDRAFRREGDRQAALDCGILTAKLTGADWDSCSRVHCVFDVYTTAATTLSVGVHDCPKAEELLVPASDKPRRTVIHVTLFPALRGEGLAWGTITCEDRSVTRAFDFPFQEISKVSVTAQGAQDILRDSSVSIYTEG